jgi:exo-beta-1,3-glucanase (GH17 family)
MLVILVCLAVCTVAGIFVANEINREGGETAAAANLPDDAAGGEIAAAILPDGAAASNTAGTVSQTAPPMPLSTEPDSPEPDTPMTLSSEPDTPEVLLPEPTTPEPLSPEPVPPESPEKSAAIAVNFGPYIRGLSAEEDSDIPDEIFREILDLLRPTTDTIRTFTISGPLERLYPILQNEYPEMRVFAGAWIDRDFTREQIYAELDKLIELGNSGLADFLLCGSENILRGDHSASEVAQWVTYVRENLTRDIPVSTSDTPDSYSAQLIDAVSAVCVTYYPYWNGVAAENAAADIEGMVTSLKERAGGKEIIISETGFPDYGDSVGEAVVNQENARIYFEYVYEWSKESGTLCIVFSAINEAWKGRYETDPEANFGLFYEDGTVKPAYAEILRRIASERELEKSENS